MLRSMQLENFKAFGQRTVIPLAPITLIFGQNSSGKSSILQSLNLLKQTRESRDVEALLLPRTENGIVDLGSFQDMIFDHDLKRQLSIRLDIAQSRNQRQMVMVPRFLRLSKSLGLEFVFSRAKPEEEISLKELKLCLGDSSTSLANFEKCELPRGMRNYVGPGYRSEHRRRMSYLRGARCIQINDDPSYWRPAYEWSYNEKSNLRKMLNQARVTSYNIWKENLRLMFDDEKQVAKAEKELDALLEDFSKFMSREFTYDEYVQRMIQDQINHIVALDGFIPIRSGRPDDELGLEMILSSGILRTGVRRDSIPDIGTATIYAGKLIEKSLGALFPLGPFRKPPSRWYIFTGTTPQDVGYQGHLLPDLLFRQHELRENTNEWLRRLEIGYEIKIHHLGDHTSDLFELRLVDTKSKNLVEVGLSDVGFGISQILPLIVQSLAACDQIISVEQPEVHIHPRLQADLADLLIEAIKEPRRNQFIIETHSEHLALRLQRRVREKLLSPEQVSIVYVSRGPNGATVQPLRLDEEGDFMDDFPGGFFPERLRELR